MFCILVKILRSAKYIFFDLYVMAWPRVFFMDRMNSIDIENFNFVLQIKDM